MLLECDFMKLNVNDFLIPRIFYYYYQTDDKAEESTQEVKPEDDKKESKGNSVKGVADNG